MLTINVGPLALAVPHVLLLVSLFLSMLTGWWVGRRSERNPEQQLFRLLLVALLIARLAFVLVYVEHFRDEPWRVIDIRDGGSLPGRVCWSPCFLACGSAGARARCASRWDGHSRSAS